MKKESGKSFNFQRSFNGTRFNGRRKKHDGTRNARRPEADAKQNVNCDAVIFRRGEGMANEMERGRDSWRARARVVVAASFYAREKRGGERESVAAHKSDINRR